MYKSSFQSSRLVEQRRYKQMLEEEQKSLARNRKLLEDIDKLQEDMRCFSHECKQDEEKLNHAKTKFMKYVKSVYPKWKEDVERWKEEKKHLHQDEKQTGPFASRQSNLHSTPHRNHQYETLSPHSFTNNYGGSLDYLRNRVGNSRDTVGFGREELGHPMDINGSYMDNSGYTGDINRSYMDRNGYTKDVGHSRDRMSYPNDRMGSSCDRMTHPRNKNPRSFRQTTDLSWDEMGYPRNDSGYPRMYNSGPWMYPQTTPPGMFPHPAHHYFAPMPAPYGVPRWGTPGYDHWSNPYGRRYEDNGKNERQAFSGNEKNHPKDASFERDERGRRELFPDARNGELYTNEGQEPHSRDAVAPFHKEDLASPPSAKHVPNDDRYPTNHLDQSYENRRKQQRKPNQRLERLSRDADEERSMEVEDTRGLEGVSENLSMNFRAEDRERIMDENNQRHVQQKNDEELTDRTTISEPFDAMKVNERREYLGDPIRDTRLTQLRNEGAGTGYREGVSMDSISLPTIHQYEGDPRDIFSDISDSEPLHQGDGKHSATQDRIDQADRKRSKDPQELGPKSAQGEKVESPALENHRGLLKRESKSSVVEDLIGDSVSDFEVSETELSDDELGGKEPLSEALLPGKVGGKSKGLHPNVDNETEVKDERKKQDGGVMSENKAEHKGEESEDKEAENPNKSMSQDKETRENVLPTETKPQGPSKVEEGTDIYKADVPKQNNDNHDGHSSDESIAEELAKTDSSRGSIEHQEDIKTKSPTNVEKSFSLKEESTPVETKEPVLSPKENSGKSAVKTDKESVEEVLSDDEKSKSVVLEEVSFSSVESTSESVPVQENNASKPSENKTTGLSYSEDFEEEKSIPLTQSAAYQKMLSAVDVSDEEDDLEEDFLGGTMSEANTTAQSGRNMTQSFQNSTSQLPAKSVKSKPTLSLFSSGERDDFGNSLGNEGVGVLSPSWKSSEGSLSPPLSPHTGGYVPSVPAGSKVEDKGREVGGDKKVLPVDGNNDKKVETGKKLQESDTKSRIQAGFWNHSDSEPEVDLQISHGGNDNDDDDDFDFYS